MAKSKEKRAAKPQSPAKAAKTANSFVKVDAAALDPTLASLFASSVRLPLSIYILSARLIAD
jgi:nucleolar protein 12